MLAADYEEVGFCCLRRIEMQKVTLLILSLSVLYANATFAVVERGILITGGASTCMEGETHFLLPDACFSPTHSLSAVTAMAQDYF